FNNSNKSNEDELKDELAKSNKDKIIELTESETKLLTDIKFLYYQVQYKMLAKLEQKR
ncbi:13796_t:CDS:1, partial [Dentiscutata erythropus]